MSQHSLHLPAAPGPASTARRPEGPRAVVRPLVLPLAGLLLAGCSATDPDATAVAGSAPAADGGIVIGVGSEPDHLNPVLGYAPDGASRLFDSLLVREADLSLAPSLATSLPEPSPDGLTWTVELRDDVVFHDGEPLTAEDVVFTYETVLDPAVASPLAGDLAALAEVVALDEGTVEFRLEQPYAPFPGRLTLGIVPEHVLTGTTDWEGVAFNREPVGSGPYRLTSWSAGDAMVLEANEQYWDGVPEVSPVTFATTTDDQARAARMSAGELDAAVLPARLAEQFEDTDGLQVQRRATADYRGVMLPQEHPVTGDLAIRRALDLAVDREAMVDGVLAGAGEPAYGPVAPSLDDYYSPAAERSHDPAAAEQLLDDTGWVLGDDGVRSRDGVRAELTVMYPAGDTVREQLALAVATDARAVGVDVTVDGLSWEAIEPRLGTDALVMGYGSPYDPDFISYQLFHSSYAGQGFFNPGSYDNPAVDEALDDGRTAVEDAERQEAYTRLQTELAADPPWLFLTYLEHVYVVSDGWQGSDVEQVEPHDHGFNAGPWWNIEDWSRRA
ncbi:ABC transporter substrate-binding protein [Jannaschia sp. R86511]|uniref:ABC transporter substrate-binding protein n=1 Tax=Jannaschia sp. R86511 TaxID=3093853 RepID=UPI0036D28655